MDKNGNNVRKKLKEIIDIYGFNVVNDPKRLESLFKDLFGSRKLEIFLLLCAQKESVAAINAKRVPYQLDRQSIAKKIIDNYGTTKECAFWAVDSWAFAFGILPEDSLEDSQEPVTERIVFSGPQRPERDFFTHYNRALELVSEFKYEQALVCFDKALEYDQFYFELYNARGLAYYNLGFFEKAIDDFSHVLELNPDYSMAYLYRANSNFNIANFKAAAADYEKLTAQATAYAAGYYYKLSCAYLELIDYDRSLKNIDTALSIDDSKSEYYYQTARIKIARNGYSEAVKYLKKAVDIDPNNNFYYFELANCCYQIDDYASAVKYYEEALRLFPDNDEYCFRLANTYRQRGDREKAAFYYNRALELCPEFDECKAELAKLAPNVQ